MKVTMVAIAVLMLGSGISQGGIAADGKEVYRTKCGACHNAMAPKLGDKKAWESRLKQGEDAMVASVIKGKGTMPPKGGQRTLSDADIKVAVQYMLEQAK